MGRGGWRLKIERQLETRLEPPSRVDIRPELGQLVDLLPDDPEHDGHLRVTVAAPDDGWPSLVVTLGYFASGGFGADALLVPETARVLVGGGNRMICYHREAGRWWRERERVVEVGFWGLARHGEMILMEAELELAAWTSSGVHRWSAFVEPPWGYEVDGGIVRLDVMGKQSTLDLRTGLPIESQAGPVRRLIGRPRG